MFNRGIKSFVCPFCESQSFGFDPHQTIMTYLNPITFVIEDVEKVIDKCIAEYTVFICRDCGAEVRYTYKDIEKKVRQNMSNVALSLLARGEIIKHGVPSGKDRVHIYCGKCNGFDGKGGCPVKIYEECEIKRFPSGI